jgi:hypothetical protein
MKWVQTVSSIAFPVWMGASVGMVSLLAVEAFETLQHTRAGT